MASQERTLPDGRSVHWAYERGSETACVDA